MYGENMEWLTALKSPKLLYVKPSEGTFQKKVLTFSEQRVGKRSKKEAVFMKDFF